jgi:hypothetical protein
MKVGKIISVEFDKFRVKLFHTTKNSTISIEPVTFFWQLAASPAGINPIKKLKR